VRDVAPPTTLRYAHRGTNRHTLQWHGTKRPWAHGPNRGELNRARRMVLSISAVTVYVRRSVETATPVTAGA